jgi:hypothetical protein
MNLVLSPDEVIVVTRHNSQKILLRRYNITDGVYIYDVLFTRNAGYLQSKLVLSDDQECSFFAAGYSAKSIFFKFNNTDGGLIGEM